MTHETNTPDSLPPKDETIATVGAPESTDTTEAMAKLAIGETGEDSSSPVEKAQNSLRDLAERLQAAKMEAVASDFRSFAEQIPANLRTAEEAWNTTRDVDDTINVAARKKEGWVHETRGAIESNPDTTLTKQEVDDLAGAHAKTLTGRDINLHEDPVVLKDIRDSFPAIERIAAENARTELGQSADAWQERIDQAKTPAHRDELVKIAKAEYQKQYAAAIQQEAEQIGHRLDAADSSDVSDIRRGELLANLSDSGFALRRVAETALKNGTGRAVHEALKNAGVWPTTEEINAKTTKILEQAREDVIDGVKIQTFDALKYLGNKNLGDNSWYRDEPVTDAQKEVAAKAQELLNGHSLSELALRTRLENAFPAESEQHEYIIDNYYPQR